MTVLTPTVRQSTRRSGFWIGAAVFLLLAALGALVLTGASTDTTPLSATNSAPDGAMAVAEVLKQQGVDVIPTHTLVDTEAAIEIAGETTLLVYDPAGFLDEDQQAGLLGLAEHLVVIDPNFSMLQTLAPGVSSAGVPDDDPLVAACSSPPAEQAGEVSPGGSAYRVDDVAGPVETCLRSDSDNADDAYSLVQLQSGDTTVSVVGATEALTNGEVTEYGNAAFALGILGETPTLLWYLPSIGDVEGAVDPASLTPRWVTPVIVLFAITALAAAFWRGRRFGPLIVENLPVVVRASETMEGRARLYQKGSARLRAIDAIRIGTLSRLATGCGLAASATVDEIVLGVAAIVDADPRTIRAMLVDTVPASDTELVHLSDLLLDLESAVAKATRP